MTVSARIQRHFCVLIYLRQNANKRSLPHLNFIVPQKTKAGNSEAKFAAAVANYLLLLNKMINDYSTSAVLIRSCFFDFIFYWVSANHCRLDSSKLTDQKVNGSLNFMTKTLSSTRQKGQTKENKAKKLMLKELTLTFYN